MDESRAVWVDPPKLPPMPDFRPFVKCPDCGAWIAGGQIVDAGNCYCCCGYSIKNGIVTITHNAKDRKIDVTKQDGKVFDPMAED